MRNLSCVIFLLLTQVALFAQKPLVNITPFGEDVDDYSFTISGHLHNRETKEPIRFGNVAIYNTDSKLIIGIETDLDGRYHLQNIRPGTYIIEASFMGYGRSRIEQIVLDSDVTGSNIFISKAIRVYSCTCVGLAHEEPMIDISKLTQSTTFESYAITNQYPEHNNSWNLHFTIHENKKEKKKRKKKSKIKESTTAPNIVQFKFDEVKSEEKVEETTEIPNQQKAEINIFPNPSNGLINITSSSPITNIITFNSLGQLVNQLDVQSDYTQQLDLSRLAAGLYYIHVHNDDGNLIQQITILE